LILAPILALVVVDDVNELMIETSPRRRIRGLMTR